MYRYKKWNIEYNPKPIPIRTHDWDVEHDDYDGEPGSDLYFTAESCEDALREIKSLEE